MARWSKGTNDHDGDGRKGGSRPLDRSDKGQTVDPSRSDPAPGPEKEDSVMAKGNKPAGDGGQPWAKPATTPTPESTSSADVPQNPGDAAGGNGGGVAPPQMAESTGNDAPPAIPTLADIPEGNVNDMPGIDTATSPANVEQAERIAEHDVAQTAPRSELPSFVRDQITPTGVDVALEMDRSPKPPLERSAYPSLGERLYQMVAGAPAELVEEFESRMLELAEDVIREMRGQDESAKFTDALVDGRRHYGPGVRSNAAKDAALLGPESGSNAERNRRARRAAERAQREAQARVTGRK